MTRRGFFGRIIAAVAAGVIVRDAPIILYSPPPLVIERPDLLIGSNLLSSRNQFVTVEQFTHEMLHALLNSLEKDEKFMNKLRLAA